MSPNTLQPLSLGNDVITVLKDIFENKIHFNALMGLKVDDLYTTQAHGHIVMRPELYGHYEGQRIHGGVISASLDTVGGLAVMNAIGARYAHEPVEQRLQHFSRLGTIDLRVDYLHPGIGTRFRMRAEVLRLGARLASTRMEFLSEEGKVLSLGTASYIVS